MSSNDPREIAVALEDLLQEVGIWSVRASQSLADASFAQRQAKESGERTWHHACVVLDQAKQDQAMVTALMTDVATMMDQAAAGKIEADHTLETAEAALQAATATLEIWEEQLEIARAWLARAEARLARALAEYEAAVRAYDYAQSELRRAESRLNACRNDRDRTNCDSEARAVNAAYEELQRAAYRLELAQAELAAAREEVAAARARVRCCENAVGFATDAVNLATESHVEAQHAVNSIERSQEFTTAADQHAGFANDAVIDEVDRAEQMITVARQAVSTIDEAGVRLTNADRTEESAQRSVRGATHEIRHRLTWLYLLNRPDLDSLGRSGN